MGHRGQDFPLEVASQQWCLEVIFQESIPLLPNTAITTAANSHNLNTEWRICSNTCPCTVLLYNPDVFLTYLIPSLSSVKDLARHKDPRVPYILSSSYHDSWSVRTAERTWMPKSSLQFAAPSLAYSPNIVLPVVTVWRVFPSKWYTFYFNFYFLWLLR